MGRHIIWPLSIYRKHILKLTLRELSERHGVHMERLCQIEHSVKTPKTIKQIKRYADIYQLSCEQFLRLCEIGHPKGPWGRDGQHHGSNCED